MTLDENELVGNGLVNADVGVEAELGVLEDKDRAVGASPGKSCVKYIARHENRSSSPEAGIRVRETDSVVESKTQCTVRLIAALLAVEQVGLDVLKNGEQSAAGRVGRSVLAVGAGNTASDGRCNHSSESGADRLNARTVGDGCKSGEQSESLERHSG